MLWFKRGLCFLSFCMLPFSIMAQFTIRGSITDAKTGETLPGVNVYLSTTTKGASTNANGVYQINEIPSGIYILVFSIIGYQKRTYQLRVRNASSSQTINVELKPKTFALGEIKVNASNTQWKNNFKKFRKEFIGNRKFANETKILNKIDISFKQEPQTKKLYAFSEKPLIIKNNALGYTLYIELDQFYWSNEETSGAYKVFPKFEEMKPKDEQQQKKWKENREKAFKGSFRHFMKSIYDDNLGKHRFTVYNKANLIKLSEGETKFNLLGRPGVSPDLVSILKGFKMVSGGVLKVNYGPPTGRYNSNKKKSSLFSNTKEGVFFIDENGNLLNPLALKISGYMASKRLAQQLPLNYHLPK